MSPDQEAEILALMRRARERERGYASFFGWAIDRDLEEVGVIRALGESLEADGMAFFCNAQSRGRGEDPPDVQALSVSGDRIAFEVTELVDGPAIEAFKAGRRYDYATWDRSKFLGALSNRLIAKAARRSSLKGGPYTGGYVIVVHTDEPALQADVVTEYLSGQSFASLVGVERAFLLLSYDPRHERCPYFLLVADA